MMKTLIAIALVAAAGFVLAPAAEARPLPCDPPQVGDTYVAEHCENVVCVVVYVGDFRYCSP